MVEAAGLNPLLALFYSVLEGPGKKEGKIGVTCPPFCTISYAVASLCFSVCAKCTFTFFSISFPTLLRAIFIL